MKKGAHLGAPEFLSGFLCLRTKPFVKILPFVSHFAQKRWCGKAGAEFLGQLVATFSGIRCADDVQPAEGAA